MRWISRTPIMGSLAGNDGDEEIVQQYIATHRIHMNKSVSWLLNGCRDMVLLVPKKRLNALQHLTKVLLIS